MTKWKEVEGSWQENTRYAVSDKGNVVKVTDLKRSYALSDAPRVTLRRSDGSLRFVKVDNLVAKAFGIKTAKRQPKHKDGDKDNCAASNLE